jgi:hypothetical protein
LSDSEVVYFIKMEAIWILINLAQGNEEEVEFMIEQGILETVNVELKILTKNWVKDLKLFYHLCWFIGNVAVTSKDIAKKVLSKTTILETI